MKLILRRLEGACGQTVGATLAELTLLIFIFFGFLNLSFSQLPISTGAPYVGQKLRPALPCLTSMASRFHWRTC